MSETGGEVSSPSITIRDATIDDLPAIEAIERASFSDPWSRRSFLSSMGRDEVLFEVATSVRDVGGERSDEVVGYSVSYIAVDQAELANVAVHASARRGGVGRLLVQSLVAGLRARGVQELFLEVRISNVAAQGLYAALGFEQVGRRKKYYEHPVEDGLVLRRQLV